MRSTRTETPRRAIHTDDLPKRFCFRVFGWRAAVRLCGGWLACMDNQSLYSAAPPPRPQAVFRMRIARVLSSSDRSQLNVCVSDLISVSHGILAYCVF